MSVSLSELVSEGVAGRVVGDPSVRVGGVRHDSRTIEPGDLFVVLRGQVRDAASFVDAALARGAVAVLCDRELETSVPQLVVTDARRALALAAAVVYGHPTFALDVVGITGTNGKTTVSYLVESILRAAGHQPAVMGTVTFRGPGFERPAPYTTPEGDEIARFARESIEHGATHLVMEVSSHALAQHRPDAVRFRVAAFTNLTQDHLDYHLTMDAYFEAKARLFDALQPGSAVVHTGDAWGRALAARVKCPLLRVSMDPAADAEVRVASWSMTRPGIRASVVTPHGTRELTSPLVGAHNVENLLVAIGCALHLGVSLDEITRALSSAEGAPGRLERIAHPRDVAVFVDYAHTPDALARALAALRPLTPGRLLAVFGCGGDRDRDKRPKMGAAAGKGADLVVVTSDNPRTENPAEILEAIVPGVQSAGASRTAPERLAEAARAYCVIEDRRAAIRTALRAARPGDTVLIAGKGHEDYQIIGHEKRPFDDRVEARRAIEEAA